MFGCNNDSSYMNTYPQCELEPKVGLCNVAVRKYYFDKDEIICKEFSLGDCVGVVPFDTLEECLLWACH